MTRIPKALLDVQYLLGHRWELAPEVTEGIRARMFLSLRPLRGTSLVRGRL